MENSERHAFVATLPFTLIEAINFVISFGITEADVYITKTFANADKIAARLRETGVFKNVYLEEDVLLTYPITVKKCWDMVMNGKRVVKEIKQRSYDYAYYNNGGWLVNSIFYTGFIKGNPKCKQRYIEHGCISYYVEYGKKPWYLRPLITLCGYKCMDGTMLEALYMFAPQFLKVHQYGEIRKMPYMDKDNRKFIEAINYIFDFDPKQNEFIDKEIIIMEQGPLGVDFDMIAFWEGVIQYIPKKNAIIKAHPRQKKSALQQMGIDIASDHSIPWEVIALNIDMSNKTQITIFSGSCLLPKMGCNIESSVVLLYKLLPVDYLLYGKQIVELADEVGKRYEDKSKFFVPETFEELEIFLKGKSFKSKL